jgi:uncharacterized protein
MIHLLEEKDRTHLMRLLEHAPELNLYMLGNLEKLGFRHELCEFWGDVTGDGAGQPHLRAVLNRYMTGWSVYGETAADWAALGELVDLHPCDAQRLQDNPGGIDSFLPFLHRYRSRETRIEEMMSLQSADFHPSSIPPGISVRRATLIDLPALAAFYGNAGDMTRSRDAILQPLQHTRLWLAEEEQTVLAAVLTNSETKHLAMIGGVYTTPSARGRGLSQAVCAALCGELLQEGKQPVLYWINPAAGAVYRKLGFQAIGRWRSVMLDKIS